MSCENPLLARALDFAGWAGVEISFASWVDGQMEALGLTREDVTRGLTQSGRHPWSRNKGNGLRGAMTFFDPAAVLGARFAVKFKWWFDEHRVHVTGVVPFDESLAARKRVSDAISLTGGSDELRVSFAAWLGMTDQIFSRDEIVRAFEHPESDGMAVRGHPNLTVRFGRAANDDLLGFIYQKLDRRAPAVIHHAWRPEQRGYEMSTLEKTYHFNGLKILDDGLFARRKVATAAGFRRKTWYKHHLAWWEVLDALSKPGPIASRRERSYYLTRIASGRTLLVAFQIYPDKPVIYTVYEPAEKQRLAYAREVAARTVSPAITRPGAQ